jgi:hypothetical protein
VVHLNELWDKYKDKGVVVIGITNEPRGLVDAFVAKNSAKYPIVIESSDSTVGYEIAAFPSEFVIGPDGRIAGTTFDPALVDSLLPKQHVAPKLPEKATAAAKALEKGKYADVRKALEAFAAGRVTVEEVSDANAFIKWIDDTGTNVLADAAAADKSGNAADAADTLNGLIEDYAGLDAAVKAADALKALLADPAKKKEVDGAKALDKVRDEARGKSAKKAIPMYKSIVANFKDTKAAAKATKIISDIEAAEAKAKNKK